MLGRIAIVAVVGLFAAPAEADHQGMAMTETADQPTTIDASVNLVAASYTTLTYAGDYEGVLPAIGWRHDRYGVGASLGLYRIMLNGLDQRGLGDLMLHAEAMLYMHDHLSAGVMMMVSAPTGDEVIGLGMGHTMVMPSLFGAWTKGRVTFDASAGFSRAIAQMEAGHDHGVWPLVDPMNMSEIAWGVGCNVALGRGVSSSVRAGGGIPVGLTGHQRVIGAARVGWGSKRVDTAVELQAGLVGDPFSIRGLVETALHF
ncbi:MAG: hypothetical protein ABI467_25755 [Kofleriaceae bacterium]